MGVHCHHAWCLPPCRHPVRLVVWAWSEVKDCEAHGVNLPLCSFAEGYLNLDWMLPDCNPRIVCIALCWVVSLRLTGSTLVTVSGRQLAKSNVQLCYSARPGEGGREEGGGGGGRGVFRAFFTE